MVIRGPVWGASSATLGVSCNPGELYCCGMRALTTFNLSYGCAVPVQSELLLLHGLSKKSCVCTALLKLLMHGRVLPCAGNCEAAM